MVESKCLKDSEWFGIGSEWFGMVPNGLEGFRMVRNKHLKGSEWF